MHTLRNWSSMAAQRDNKNDATDRLHMFTELSVKGAEAIRQQLGIEEQAYLSVAGHVWQDARAYVLYTSLDEVDKSVVHGLMLIPNLLDETGYPFSVRSDRIDRVFVTQFLEQLESRLRRDLEVLVNLVLFSQTNHQSYYRHFLLLEQLDSLLGANSDLEEFYGCQSANIDESISRVRQHIREVETELDLEKCWYLRSRKPLDKQKRIRPGHVLDSVRGRLKLALKSMSNHERVMSRFSYERYGRLSKAVHYAANRRDFGLDARQLEVTATELGLTCFCMLERCRALLDLTGLPIPDQISKVLEATSPENIVQSLTVGEARVGDIVLAYGDLAEVVELRDSEYDYRSYRVRYLAERPKPHIHEDWFPAGNIRRIYSKERLLAELQRLTKDAILPSDVLARMECLAATELQEIMRHSVVQTWQSGLKDWMKRRRG